MKKKRVFGTGGELLVHQLVAQGVKYAFTNTGSAEAGFFNALLTVPGVQPILLLAESLVLSAADGYAKASREPAFVNVHLAAGTRQGSGQLQNAYFDGTPMVVTAAMRDSGSFGDHNTLGSSGGFSQMGAVEDITKRRWEVWDARGIPTVTRRAFKDAMTFPTGPVYEQPELPDRAHELRHVRRRDGQAAEVSRGVPRRSGDRLRDAGEVAGHRGVPGDRAE